MKHLLSAFFLTLVSGIALADFVGMEYEAVAETANGTTYRVYATFDNATDELVAVYALEDAPMVVGVSTSFYQDAVGAVLAQTINPAFLEPFLLCNTTAGSPLVRKIPMARATFSKWAWTRTSPALKRVEDSPSTRSLVVRGSCCPTKVPMQRQVPMVAS